MRSIGEMARDSGLSVSALRFYDGAGVLVPAVVDPGSGYRWYDQRQLGPARLLASLRRVGMPLAEITRLLDRWPADPDAVRDLLDAHLRRLEDGLADARRELSRVHALLDREENPMTGNIPTRLTLAGPELATALDAVRFAVGSNPELPVLGGVLFDVDGDLLRLVATDRYRLAVSAAPIRSITGPPVRVLVPAALVDEARALLAESTDEVTIEFDGAEITVGCPGRTARGEALPHDFPDYRRLLHDQLGDPGRQRVTFDVDALRAALRSTDVPTVVREHEGVSRDLAVLTVGRDGALTLIGEDALAGTADHVGVNREFLLEALDAGAWGQLVLELDGPIKPLALRVPGNDRTFSVLMPVRLR